MAKANRGGQETATSSITTEPTKVALADIVMNPALQIRAKTDPSLIQQYKVSYQTDKVMPPVTVAVLDGALVLIDGWHRVSALRLLGQSHVDAYVLTGLTFEEARWRAAKANLSHGRQLNRKEQREAFRAYVKAGHHRIGKLGLRSLRDIALALPATHSTIWRWFQDDFPAIAESYGGGKEDGEDTKGEIKALRKSNLAIAMEAIETTSAAARGVRSRGDRGQLVVALEEALEFIRADAPYVLPDVDTEDDF